MRLLALLPLALTACGTPLPADPPPAEITPIAHIAGAIGPVDGIDADGKLATSEGSGFSATITAETPSAWVMTRLSVRDAGMLAPGFDRTFAFINDEGVAMVACAGSAEGRWDLIDAPAETMHVHVDDASLVTVTAQLREQDAPVETRFPLSR